MSTAYLSMNPLLQLDCELLACYSRSLQSSKVCILSGSLQRLAAGAALKVGDLTAGRCCPGLLRHQHLLGALCAAGPGNWHQGCSMPACIMH